MGIRYKYIRNADKQTILFLHGWGGNENSFDNIFWKLSSNFSVIAVNLTDITSKYLNKPITLHDYLVKVQSILYRCGINRCHIVCHSFGFRVSLLIARDTDIQIDSMVVIDGAGIRYQSLVTKFKILKYKLIKKLLEVKLLPSKFLKVSGSADYNILSDRDKTTFRNIVNYDLRECLKFINCDTTIIWGKYDQDTILRIGRYIRRSITNSKFIIYDTGHFSYLENKLQFLFDIDEHFSKYLII